MSLHIDIDAPTVAQAVGSPGPLAPTLADAYRTRLGMLACEPADCMPDPYFDALAEATAEWRWLVAAMVLVAGCAIVASCLWPWSVL